MKTIAIINMKGGVSVPYWGSLYFNTVLRSPYNYRAAKPDCGAKPNPAFTI